MADFNDRNHSQFATSANPLPKSESPRPKKRTRTNPIADEHQNGFPFSKASPSKPPRQRKPSNPLGLFLFSDCEEIWEKESSPKKTASESPQRNQSVEDCPFLLTPLSKYTPASVLEGRDHCLTSNNSSTVAPKVASSKRIATSSQHRSRLLDVEVQKLLSDPNAEARLLPELPLGLEVPSPPPSSSDESDIVCSAAHSPRHYPQPGKGETNSQPSCLKMENTTTNRRPKLIETCEPPAFSQDSAYFSFSRQPAQRGMEKDSVQLISDDEDKRGKAEHARTDGTPDVQAPYYLKSLNYVLAQVLERYGHVLNPRDIQVADLLRNEISQNAYCLFARIYRRKQPHWYRVSRLEHSYGQYLDVQSAIVELGSNGLLISSRHAAKMGEGVKLILAKELLWSLRGTELRSVVKSVPYSEQLKKLPVKQLIPALEKILRKQAPNDSKKKYKQATLSGLSQLELLAQGILRHAGHAVKVPESVLVSLQRIHFLFFLEDGHNSPNVILADVQKAKFPDYKCKPKNGVFPSAHAYKKYETAIKLEQELNQALEWKDFETAADLGSIAELEVREYLWCYQNPTLQDTEEVLQDLDLPVGESKSSTGRVRLQSIQSSLRNVTIQKEAMQQLRHPFFRRFTAQWVYVRSAWHSVHALERLEEYENAIQRLKLLLSTGLVPARRGKCLNRLTINLFKHQGILQESLDLILSALDPTAPTLHFGDRMSLVKRGLSIFRKMTLPLCEEEALKMDGTKAERKRMISDSLNAKRPKVLVQAMKDISVIVNVRKIYGKSLQISGRERQRRETHNRMVSWNNLFTGDDSRDSTSTVSTADKSVMGKSWYPSLGSRKRHVSVETYVLQWYLGKDGWLGVHDEGSSLRFLFALLLWECALFAPIEDVFQTPYQDRPLDLFTEAFYSTRKTDIDNRLEVISAMDAKHLRDEVQERYERYEMVRAIGCNWKKISAEDLAHIGAGLGGTVLAHCCKLFCEDYSYWGGGLPDLTLWKSTGIPGSEIYHTKLVEVKSARDNLSERQRAWLIELQGQGAECEVCKVVEKVTSQNSEQLQDANLDTIGIGAIDAADSDGEP